MMTILNFRRKKSEVISDNKEKIVYECEKTRLIYQVNLKSLAAFSLPSNIINTDTLK